MSRLALILPSTTYRAGAFIDAAGRLGADVLVVSDVAQTWAGPADPRALVVDCSRPDEAAAAIAERAPLDAVVAVDDVGVVTAALASQRLGLAHNPPDAVAATRDKAVMRRAFAAAGVPQADFALAAGDVDDACRSVGFPVVVKALGLSGSRGVLRADDAGQAARAAARIRAIVGDASTPLLVESYVPGAEVAVEGLLRSGRLETLAIFDKPDPLTGPVFEETIYVTPSGLPEPTQRKLSDTIASASAALGLAEGPIHAEARVDGETICVLEVASRSIGGLCARTLRFGLGISLEEVILRHALGRPLGRVTREREPAGVMMIPIPSAGVLTAVSGRDDARQVPGVRGVEITIPVGDRVVPLPEGDRYLGFVFATGDTPEDVEASLRAAHARLAFTID